MCSECHMTICPAGCPNAEDPPVVYYCDGCGGEIYEGDTYCEIADGKYCENCVDDSRKTAYVDD